MKIQCPRPGCLSHTLIHPKTKRWVRKGFFYRKSDSKLVRRYRCSSCRLSFSAATTSPHRYEKKRAINAQVFEFYCSGVSQRRLARALRVNPKTIVRKIRLHSRLEKKRHLTFLNQRYGKAPLLEVQFDDLETSVHTKCKPVSVSLAVDARTRVILGFEVSVMPAKGHLAEISRKKYGPRKDERRRGLNDLFCSLIPYVQEASMWTSDENPLYPSVLKAHFPKATHIRKKGGRAAATGQGELKKLYFDPLFSLNHTCAMLRANMNRLVRRTWCTTKKIEGLMDHLWLYMGYHNRVLTQGSDPL